MIPCDSVIGWCLKEVMLQVFGEFFGRTHFHCGNDLPGVAPKQRPGLVAHRGAGRLRGVDISGEPADGPDGVC